MAFYNIYQGNPKLSNGKQPIWAVEEDEVYEMIRIHLKGGGSYQMFGRSNIINGKNFQIYRVNENVGYTHDDIKQFYLTRKSLIYSHEVRQDLFRHEAVNVTKEMFKYVQSRTIDLSHFKTIAGFKMPMPKQKAVDEEILNLLHIKIREVSESLFNSKHFKEAVFAAIVEVVDVIKEICCESIETVKMDGKSLMMTVFSEVEPLIKIVEDNVKDAKGIQEGYKFIFAGMVLAIRNPKAHKNYKIDKTDAIEMLLMCSRLMRKLDERIVK